MVSSDSILNLGKLSEKKLMVMCIGIVGPPADHLLGFQGVAGAKGPRFRKLSKEEIEDYLTNL